MEKIRIIRLDETASTNRFLREYRGEEGARLTVAVAEYQTAGRGQGDNSWESERGKNLTYSLKLHPMAVTAARQYVLLEAAALALRDVLAEMIPDVTIKWPNDIYYRDMKISGTLSECTVNGTDIADCIIGTGINVNQRKFVSNAPNPVSLYNILGRETDRENLLHALLDRTLYYMDIVDGGGYDVIDELYLKHLYRRNGFFRYADVNGEFMAEVVCVEPDGHLVLRRDSGGQSRYAFKEVGFIID